MLQEAGIPPLRQVESTLQQHDGLDQVQAGFLTTSLSYPMHPWRQICRRARQQRIPPPGPHLGRGTICLDLHSPVRLYHLDGLNVLRITLYSRSTLYLCIYLFYKKYIYKKRNLHRYCACAALRANVASRPDRESIQSS